MLTGCLLFMGVGKVDMLHFLISSGMGNDTVDGEGRSPIHWAAANSYTDALHLLLSLPTTAIDAPDAEVRVCLPLVNTALDVLTSSAATPPPLLLLTPRIFPTQQPLSKQLLL